MGLFSSIKKFFFGSKRKKEQLPRYTPQQEQALNQLLSQGMSNQNPQAIEDRYTRMFEEDIMPGIAEQFTGMGAQGSGAFRSALGRAGGDLASQLAALRSGRGMQQTQIGLTPQFDTNIVPGTPGYFQKNLSSLEQMIFAMASGGGKLQGGGAFGSAQDQQQGSIPQQQGGYLQGQPQGYNPVNLTPLSLKMMMGQY